MLFDSIKTDCELLSKGVYFTGASLNPARTLGPAVANRNFPDYFWIYWIGPLVGALLASGFYAMLRSLEYQTVLPNQDADKAAASAPIEPVVARSASSDVEKPHHQRRRSLSSSSTLSLTPGRPEEMKLPDW
jgi:aquaporin related protein